MTSAIAYEAGKATTTKSMFSRCTVVSIDIKADAAIVWALLTNAQDYPRWNSTIISIEGNITANETIKLKSSLAPKRIFKLKILVMDAGKRLVWGDAMGKREYTITQKGQGIITFSMTEKIGGPLFPLFAGMIPSFDQSFEQFASDLKREAETIMNEK